MKREGANGSWGPGGKLRLVDIEVPEGLNRERGVPSQSRCSGGRWWRGFWGVITGVTDWKAKGPRSLEERRWKNGEKGQSVTEAKISQQGGKPPEVSRLVIRRVHVW